ncbi:sialate O-acetylesterase [Cellulophaga baltica]|uniref:sialate O-acetylesterase n=1 Tax=Cellulophaga TaxID=104264 RepID=UPI001C071EC9|nr:MULTISPECIES: sialate O-acetylesterase [Cellulophaga]MBU2995876.1 sialate O-acetylesterase [Cellulophaga baltica]MDO6767271.1 sialate O-acetylesterase [Cellulophaga sp. 1_MG-2023]
MKQPLLILLILLSLPTIVSSQLAKKDTIRVFYLGGQSNMDGHGSLSDLPKELKSEFENVYIFHGNPAPDENKNGGQGVWDKLKPGHGKLFLSNLKENKLSNYFGIELSFAKKLQTLYPNDKIALIKYSKGGTSIDTLASRNAGTWEPDFNGKTGINQYDHFLNTVRLATETNDIDKNGITDVLVHSGIIWMQGESDAHNEEVAKRYYDNLKRLLDLVRASFRTGDMPVVIGKISDSGNNKNGKVWEYGELVQYAQEKFALTDKNATIVRSTKNYKYSDKWHYDSEGYIDLGEKFADAIYQLNHE